MSAGSTPQTGEPPTGAELEDGGSSPLQPLISARSTLSVEQQTLSSEEQQAWAGGKAPLDDGAAAASCPAPGQFVWVSEPAP